MNSTPKETGGGYTSNSRRNRPIQSNDYRRCSSNSRSELRSFDGTELNTRTEPIALDRASYNQGKNAQYEIGVDESGTAFTVVAKGPGLVAE